MVERPSRRTYCFGCGAEMTVGADVVAPMCANCRPSDSDDSQQMWMVRRKGQRPQGPHKQEVVEEWIQRELVRPEDEVSRVDAPWASFAEHADFRGWYTPGDPRFEERLAVIGSRKKQRSARDWSRRVRTVSALAGIAVVVAFTTVAIRTDITVVPQDWIVKATSTWRDLTADFFDTMETATSDPAELRAKQEDLLLEGDEIIGRLAQELPASEEPARLYLLRGRDLLMKEISDAPESAIRQLEMAAVTAPRDVTALASLAEIYALAGRYEPARADDAVVLLSRVDWLRAGLPATLRARAVLAITSGANSNAVQVADTCINDDPENLNCYYYKGMALLALERWSEAESILRTVYDKAPHVPRYKLALCQAAVESGSYLVAREKVDAFVEEYPHVSEGYAVAARLAWLTADYRRALKEAEKATRLDASKVESRLLAAELRLAADDAPAAIALIEPVLEDEALRAHKMGPRALVVASHAQRAMGRLDEALALARRASEMKPNWSPTAYALGVSLHAVGSLEEAERTLKEASTDDLHPVEAGRFYVKLGRIYQEQRRAKAAMTFYERAVEEDPGSAEARLGLVDVYLCLGNLSRAIDMLRTIAPEDFEQSDTHPPNSLCPLEAQSVRPLEVAIRQAVAQDIRFSKVLASMEGILAYHAGDLARADSRLTAALVEADTDDTARAYLARIKMRQGKNLEAEGILTRLLATPGNEGIYSAMLGVSQSRAGRELESLTLFERLIKLVDTLPGAHRLYAEALFRAGQEETGLEEARKAYQLDDLDHHARRLVLTRGKGSR